MDSMCFESVVNEIWLQLFKVVIKDVKIPILEETRRDMKVPELNQAQLAIMEDLIKNKPTTFIGGRGIGTSTAIYLFLVGNLMIGKYNKVALVNNCGAADHYAMNRIGEMLAQINIKGINVQVNTRNRLVVNGHSIETRPLDMIDQERNSYDLIIFDNIGLPNCKRKDYGVSIYTSETWYIKDRIVALQSKVSEKLRQAKEHLLEIDVLEDKLKYYNNVVL